MRTVHRALSALFVGIVFWTACGAPDRQSASGDDDATESEGGATMSSGGGGTMSSGGGGHIPCDGGFLCERECIDLSADPLHCGDCDQPCDAGEVCDGGSCAFIEDCTETPCPGLSYCDLATKHCLPGCLESEQCSGGQDCNIVDHTCNCPSGTHLCSGVCSSDDALATCGDSCTPCPTDPNGDAACNEGQCALACDAGFRLQGSACPDIDECAEGADNCDPRAGCINQPGSFSCGACPTGSIDVNGNGTQCAFRVGLDAIHGNDGNDSLFAGSDFVTFRSVVTDGGDLVEPLVTFDAAELQGVNAVVIKQPYWPDTISDSVVSALTAFVAGGGGLLVIADGGTYAQVSNINKVASVFGVRFSSNEEWLNGIGAIALGSHPVMNGVSAFGVVYGLPMSQVNAPAVSISQPAVLAAADGIAPAGNVILIGDSTVWSNSPNAPYDIDDWDSQQLLRNVIAHITQ